MYIPIYLYVFISLSPQNTQLDGESQLKVFPFANAQHLSDIGFVWKREACSERCEGKENELKVTAEDCTVCYSCEISKNGTEYFTSYHFLKGCKFTFFISTIKWLHTC